VYDGIRLANIQEVVVICALRPDAWMRRAEIPVIIQIIRNLVDRDFIPVDVEGAQIHLVIRILLLFPEGEWLSANFVSQRIAADPGWAFRNEHHLLGPVETTLTIVRVGNRLLKVRSVGTR